MTASWQPAKSHLTKRDDGWMMMMRVEQRQQSILPTEQVLRRLCFVTGFSSCIGG